VTRFLVLASLLALSACGQQAAAPKAGDVAGRHADACALIADPAALFGKDTTVSGDDGFDDMAGRCSFASADGRRGGDVILYNAASLGAVTPEKKLADTIAFWARSTFTPPAPIEKLGDEAQIVTDLPGQQVQIALRKGGLVILISARSGEAKRTAEDIVRKMAAQAAAAP
jgi:HSP20 family molecular chaperone IbpA